MTHYVCILTFSYVHNATKRRRMNMKRRVEMRLGAMIKDLPNERYG